MIGSTINNRNRSEKMWSHYWGCFGILNRYFDINAWKKEEVRIISETCSNIQNLIVTFVHLKCMGDDSDDEIASDLCNGYLHAL